MNLLLSNGKINRKHCGACGGTGKFWQLIWPYNQPTVSLKTWGKLVKRTIVNCDCEEESDITPNTNS